MKPTSIAELMGAPIEVVNIRSYGPGWKNPEDVQNLITKLLKTQTSGVYTYEPWAEAAFAAIIATVQFSDHSEGTLEVSGVHVCFSDHSRLALWLRVFRNKIAVAFVPRSDRRKCGDGTHAAHLATFCPDTPREHHPAALHGCELPPRQRPRRLPRPSPPRPRTCFLPRATRPHSPNPHFGR